MKMREAIKENEDREYAASYVNFMMKKENGKWTVTTKSGYRYELDA